MDIKWMLRRMRAMSASELCWRVQMKALTKREKKLFYDKHLPVTQFAPDKPRKPDGARLSLNWENEGTRYTRMRRSGITARGGMQAFRRKMIGRKRRIPRRCASASAKISAISAPTGS